MNIALKSNRTAHFALTASGTLHEGPPPPKFAYYVNAPLFGRFGAAILFGSTAQNGQIWEWSRVQFACGGT